MQDDRDETLPMFMTHQSMKKTCTSVTFLEKITLDLLGK